MLRPDPIESSDPSIRFFAERHAALMAEHDRLAASIGAYIRYCPEPEGRVAMAPLEHFDMLDSPDCGCPTCSDWERRRAEFVRTAKLVPKGHKWTVCGCDDCRFVGRIQLNFLAATNRRDLLISLAFHARYHSTHPDLVMRWLEQEMKNPAYTVNWCAQEMSRYPVERWLKRCEVALSGAISGAVFVDSTMVTDLRTYITSTLSMSVEANVSWV